MDHQDRSHASPSFINIFVLLLFAAVIAFASSVGTYMYMTSQKNQESPTNQPLVIPQTAVSPTSTSANPITTSDETANWKTYTNNRYGYNIKYPANWFVSTKYSEMDFTRRGGYDVGITYYGGDTAWSNYPKFDYTPPDPPPSDSQFIGLIILKTDQSLDDYYNSTYNDPNDPETKVLEKEKSTIQGKGLLKFTYVNFINTLKTNNPQGAKARKALVKINNGIMIFSYSIEEYKKDESKIFDSMIDSLRFTR
ncbi:MAG TPA: hypothetical protein VJH96_01545 [Patescibacteria group bacterium]|nr:hypothetical protein [Patescibacteria group bacterium]